MEIKEAKTIIECLLFVSDKPLSLTTIKALLEDMDRRDIIQCLDELKAEYDTQARAFHLVEIAEGYQMVTRVSLAPWIRKLYKNRSSNKLSRAALETMAIIAYRQPISKAEVEDIRGVSADGVVNSLLERKLIRVVGRKEVIGRPLLYGTTKEFLHYFGLKDLSDMPELKDLQDMLRQDEVGEDWEMNPEGNLVAKIKTKDETEFITPESGSATPALEPQEHQTAETTEVTMQPYMEQSLATSDGGNGHPAVVAGTLDTLEQERAALDAAAEKPLAETAPRNSWQDDYEGSPGDDEDAEDDEDDEDLDDLDDEDDAEDEEDADDEEDEDDLDDEDDDEDLEDDDDLDDEDDDADDLDEEDDEDADDEDEDEDDDDLDDIDDLGSAEEETPKKGRGKSKLN